MAKGLLHTQLRTGSYEVEELIRGENEIKQLTSCVIYDIISVYCVKYLGRLSSMEVPEGTTVGFESRRWYNSIEIDSPPR